MAHDPQRIEHWKPVCLAREHKGLLMMLDGENRRDIRRVLVALALVTVVVIVVWLLTSAAQGVLVIFAGVLGAVFLVQVSSRLAQLTSLSYHWALGVVVAALVVLLAGTSYLLGARIAERTGELVEQLRHSSRELETRIAEQAWGQQLLQRTEKAEEMLTSQQAVATAGTALTTLLAGVTGAIVTIFLAFYFSVQPDYYRSGLLALTPPNKRKRICEVLDRIGTTLWWWLLGRIAGMLIIGVSSAIGLWIIGIPLAVELGVLAGLLTFIPNIGPVLSVVPPVLFGLEEGMGTAGTVVGLYIGLQFVESYLLTPLIEQHQVQLPPGLTLSSQVLLGLLFGFLGVFLATPLTVVIYVLVRELYVKDVLGGHEPERCA